MGIRHIIPFIEMNLEEATGNVLSLSIICTLVVLLAFVLLLLIYVEMAHDARPRLFSILVARLHGASPVMQAKKKNWRTNPPNVQLFP